MVGEKRGFDVMSAEEPRIGVFICECGGNISDIVDVKKVKEKISTEEGVVVAKTYRYVCSKPGLDLIKDSIKKKDLNRVVIAACTPKMHYEFFRRGVRDAGLNDYLLARTNIREQCSWVHPDDPEGATEKSIDLVKGSVAFISKAEPLKPYTQKVLKSVLVIGGGVAGISTSLRLANSGYRVHLVEEAPTIGGNAIKFTKVFPTLDCAQCILTPKMVEVATNPNVSLHTYSQVESVSGTPGNYRVRVRAKPRGVDPESCIACGVCSKVCPVEVVSEHDEGLGTRKAVYIPFPQAVPTTYTVDFDHCTRCGECETRCPRKSINLEDQGRSIDLDVGAIVVATGFQLYDLGRFGEFHLEHPNVVTSLQMERMMDISGPTNGKVTRLSDGNDVSRIAYVLCAGSRDVNKGVPYCSRVCCLYAIKQARLIKETFGIDVWIHYIDVRAPGRRYEEFYLDAQNDGVVFMRGMVSKVIPNGDTVIIQGVDTLSGEIVRNEVDLAVLCPPIVPRNGTAELADLLKIPTGEDGFLLERHPKLDPVSTQRQGVYAAGMALGPKDIQSTVAEAWGAASNAMEFLGEGVMAIEPNKAFLRVVAACDGCGECVEICPTEAIAIKEGKASINEIICNGCGVCIQTCRYDALDLRTPSDDQLKAQIEATLAKPSEKPRILVFIEEAIAYTAADTAGVNRVGYPSSTRFIAVPSTARLKLDHVVYAFAKGADGVLFAEAPAEGPLGKAHIIAEERAKAFRKAIRKYKISPMRFRFAEVYAPNWAKFATTLEAFDEIIRSVGPLEAAEREKIVKRLLEAASVKEP